MVIYWEYTYTVPIQKEPYLVNSIKELEEDGTEVVGGGGGGVVAFLRELVPKRYPVLLNKHLEALECAVVGVQQYLSQRHHLEGRRERECVSYIPFSILQSWLFLRAA